MENHRQWQAVGLIERLRSNAFWILEIPASASRAEMERAAQKILGLVKLQVAHVRWVATPLGRIERTEEVVVDAVRALRDDRQREVQAQLLRFAQLLGQQEVEVSAPVRLSVRVDDCFGLGDGKPP